VSQEVLAPRDVRIGAARDRTAAWAFAVLGCIALAARPLLPEAGRSALLALVYAALLVGSLLERDGTTLRARPRAAAAPLVVGFAALAVVRVASGPALHPEAGAMGVGLTLLASVGEEAFFRRFLYGRLSGLGASVAIGTTAALFALVHLPAYGLGALWVDLGAGALLGWQRWASGTWLVPAATHVAANLLVVMG
jgi:membrane protease YdiL (CAAX protease family)